MDELSFYEFFAGGGMARAGLGPNWSCLFANDFDHKKAATYRDNWGSSEIVVADIREVDSRDIPPGGNLAWASFPCQDLSLAGGGAGLRGERSGTFWPFWGILTSLADNLRAPALVVLENVCGALTSHSGKDFRAICAAFREIGYRVGALVLDASRFLPQSRPRLFIIGVGANVEIPDYLRASGPSGFGYTSSLVRAFDGLPLPDKENWIWWALQTPTNRTVQLKDLVDQTKEVKWHDGATTKKLISMMSPVNRAKLEEARRGPGKVYGTLYRRTRSAPGGSKLQRAEIRFDIAGCLRTPAGGSSRQTLVEVSRAGVRTRLLTAREACRLMGLPDSYRLPVNYNESYHLAGDGVVVPVVRFLAASILEPVLTTSQRARRATG